MNKPNTVIISASGEKSFTVKQVEEIKKYCNVTFYKNLTGLTKEDFVKISDGYEIVAVTRRAIKDIDKQMIDGLNTVKSLIVYSTGYEWVDIDYLNKKDITLSNLPNYSTRAVAEHTVGVLLSLSARLHLDYELSKGLLSDKVSVRGFELHNKNIGIIGLGRIGSLIAQLLSSFELTVNYYDIQIKDSPKANYLPYEKLLKTSDFLIIMANKVRNSPPLLTDREFDLIKKDAFVINTSRADHVDNKAIISAIKKKKIYGYAVDDIVEDFLKDDSIEPGRILMTSHTAWYTTEAIKKGAEEWTQCIIAAAKGNPINVIKKWGD